MRVPTTKTASTEAIKPNEKHLLFIKELEAMKRTLHAAAASITISMTTELEKGLAAK